MKRPHYWTRKQNLDGLITKIESSDTDLEILAHLAKYLVVLVCGWLETAVYEIFHDYSKRRASPEIADFVFLHLKRSRSPMMKNLIELTQQFSEDWAIELEKNTKDELADSVNSIVSNRHLIAHGESCNVTLGRVKNYYKGVVKVVKLIERQCS